MKVCLAFFVCGLLIALSDSAEAQHVDPSCANCNKVARALGFLTPRSDVDAVVSHMPDSEKAAYVSRQARAQLLCEMIEEHMLAEEARRRGIADQLPVKREVDRILANALMRRVLREVDRRPITDAQIERYYGEHPTDFIRPARVRLAMIVTESERDARSVQQRASRLNERRFGKLAKKVSMDDYTRIRGGKTPWIYQDAETDHDLQLVQAAFEMKTSGKLSPLRMVKGDDEKYYVFRLLVREEAQEIPISQVKSSIQSRIRYERREATKLRYLQNLARSYTASKNPLAETHKNDKVSSPSGRPRQE